MDTQKAFTLALMKLADRIASESKGSFYPIKFRQDVEEKGGLKTAKDLINKPISEGFFRLIELGRTDLSVEAFVLNTPEYQPLFTEEELAICRTRIEKL